jgi:hypothetical protein
MRRSIDATMGNAFDYMPFLSNIDATLKHSTIGDRAFPVAASRVWNSLASAVKSVTSLPVFRQLLKNALFTRSYGIEH